MRKYKHGRVGVKRVMPMGKAEKDALRRESFKEGWKDGYNYGMEQRDSLLKDLATEPNVRAVRSRIAAVLNG